jgi:SPP1 gp7 family putative phage head morphogenesis protein
LNSRLSFLYDCDCEDCKTQTYTLAIGESKIKPLLSAVETAFKQLHKKGNYEPSDIAKTKAYKNLVTETSQIFNGAIADNDIPGEMAKSLKEDVFIFSGLKTNAQLAEASRLLLTEDGKVKSFSAFSKDVESIKENYNQKYLDAEYQFAVSSAQSAGNWGNISNDYDLQYRTAGDDRVRDSHDKLRDTTLPADDAFWISYYPPNGWRCRCTAVQVRKGKFDLNDSKKAIAEGEKATSQIDKDGKNKLAIFRFNPGIQKVVFPPTHPYTKVAGAQTVRKELKANNFIEPQFIPDGIDVYEKKLGVTINKDIFSYLSKKTPFTTVNIDNKIKSPGAYYHPIDNYVKIPIDARRKESKWYSQCVVYHEFGHAADFQNGFKELDVVTNLMDKYRKEFSKKSNKLFKENDQHINKLLREAYLEDDKDKFEKIGAVSDTLMSLNSNFGSGHAKGYWEKKGNSEAEFLAHTFENKFIENDMFEKVMPELYRDMIKLAEELKAKVK